MEKRNNYSPKFKTRIVL